MPKRKLLRYAGVGISVTIVDYVIYTVLVKTLLTGDVLWVASAISGLAAAVVAYVLHKNITWKNRDPGKTGVIKFFAWNALTMLVIRPALVWELGRMSRFYQFLFETAQSLRLPVDYRLVESTTIYLIAVLVVVILNFLVYDRVVFGKNGKKYLLQEK